MSVKKTKKYGIPVLMLLVLIGAGLLCSTRPTLAAMKFAQKECLDCHKKFADKYLGMKDVHPVVKENKCEECHLRHGIVPKLLLKETGNSLCLRCHSKEKIGMNKANVHTALKTGKCTLCHNPHASQGSHLLQAEGSAMCYQCHKKDAFEKKVVHKVLAQEGCKACHMAHSAEEKIFGHHGCPA